MTSQFIDQDIRRDEGLELQAYADPDSPLGKQMELKPSQRCAGWNALSGAPWTVGYGCTGSDIGPGTRWTLAQAVSEQVKRRQQAEAQLDQAIPWWRKLSPLRQDVFANMTYQLGCHGLLEFRGALAAAEQGDFDTCAVKMLDSDWARETPSRAKRLALQMRTDTRAGSTAPAVSNSNGPQSSNVVQMRPTTQYEVDL